MSDINKIMEAYLGMVSAPQVEETLEEKKIGNMGPYGMATITKALAANGIKGAKVIGVKDFLRKSGTVNEEVEEELDEACGKKHYKEEREECPKCEGEGCDHCDGKGYHEKEVNEAVWTPQQVKSVAQLDKEFASMLAKKGINPNSQEASKLWSANFKKRMNDIFESVDLEEKKLDPVDDAENDKKFKNRKDKDIDNDGDVDSSDEYLHKRRKATDDAIDGGKKPAKESAQVDEVSAELAKAAFKSRAKRIDDLEKEKGKETNKQGRAQIDKEIGSQDKKLARSHAKSGSDKPLNKSYDDAVKDKDTRSPSQKYADYKKDGGNLSMDDWKKRQRESFDLDLSLSFAEMWQQMQEAIDPKKGATAPEKHDDHSSEHDKKVIAQHKKSDKKVEDQEEKSHDSVFKAAGKDMKQAPARSGADNLSNGDKKIINPVKK